ncbi:cysteine--tRNA ligase [Candidatus Nomurabacteria bacterium]|nr:MAG: cysteine--tRNA ligase [Candidatus Nomurabacteria bacterium]
MRLYNSLTKEIDEFKPASQIVGLYTCGPTVYDYVTIGNWRTYILGDIVYRALKYNGLEVNYVMNLTDVGHLTGDNLGDADTGEDRMEKAKKREGKGAFEIAQFYIDDFLSSYKDLNLLPPNTFARATEHISEQIDLIKKLEEKGLTYNIDDGVYFDTIAFEAKGYKYGELSNLDKIKAGARVEFNQQKKNPRDFALWKFSPKDEKRDMEWESPWGTGFPGWHIECSAMSMKYLGEQFDIHVGGEDLKSTHHPNEIAQSEGATDKSPFVKCWMHGAFLQVDGGKMGKSLGNAYSLHDIVEKRFSPMALRYFYFSSHYRSSLNFTWEALEASQNAYNRLLVHIENLGEESGSADSNYLKSFNDFIDNDLEVSRALALLWDLLKDDSIEDSVKLATVAEFDKVLGLDLIETSRKNKNQQLPKEVEDLASKRHLAREDKDWVLSDSLRQDIEKLGYEVKDLPNGDQMIRKNN